MPEQNEIGIHYRIKRCGLCKKEIASYGKIFMIGYGVKKVRGCEKCYDNRYG